MKIVSYNVNGVRAAINKDLAGWMKEESPDVLCLQETKAQPEQIDTMLFAELGYTTYAHSAEKKGYSGVAILTKKTPDNIVIGMNNPKYDSEGRVIRADYGDLSIVNVYIPSGSSGDERQAFKMEFLEDFLPFITELRKERPNLVVCGDYNICHKPIDINNPQRQVGVSGFLPEEREWVDRYEATGMIDTFRVFDQSRRDTAGGAIDGGARYRNVGSALIITGSAIRFGNRLKAAQILVDAVHSDHCPVTLELL